MSKLIFFDFECAEHGLFEDLVHPDEHQAPCPKCALPARRQISTFRIDHTAMALSPSASPESIAKFERKHREQKAKEAKQYERHRDYPNMAKLD